MTKLKNETLLHTPTSLNRIQGFDLARGLAILLMMIVHTLDFYGSSAVRESLIGSTFKTLVGWPAASVFVFIMGVFVAYSPSATLGQALKRAAFLFLLGYVLNLFRGTIPMWLSLKIGLVTYEQLGVYTPLTEFLVIDVLQFAGIALAVCALLRHYLRDPLYWVFTAVMVNFISPLFWDISSGNFYLDEVFQLFWGDNEQGAVFPQFPWLTYPIVGMAFGCWLKKAADNELFFSKMLWVSAATMLIGIGITLTNVEYHLAQKLRGGPGLIVSITGFTMLVLCICQLVTRKINDNLVFSLLYKWSRHVTIVYVIQWLLIGWGLMFFGANQLDTVEVLLSILGVIMLSDILTRLYVRNILDKGSTDSSKSTVLNAGT